MPEVPQKQPWSDALLSWFRISKTPQIISPYGDSDFDAISGGAQNPYYEWIRRELTLAKDRIKRYKDYDEMDRDPRISAVIDVYVEEATQVNMERNATLWVESDDTALRMELNALLADIEVEDTIAGVTRTMCKYGDNFEKLFYLDQEGVHRMVYSEPSRVIRIEDEEGSVKGWDEVEARGDREPRWRPWDYVHWRLLLGRRSEFLYGDSLLEEARRLWMRLTMLEDAISLYRLQRAPDRNVYYVDVQNSSPEQAYEAVNKWRRKYRKNVFWDAKEGRLITTHNPIAIDEDIFWPVRDGSSSKVERLSGSANIGDIADLEYFRDQLYEALRVPKGYLGGSQDTGMGLNPHLTLAAQDLRVARRVKRIQRAVMTGYARLCQIHYAMKFGAKIYYPRNFRLGMTFVSVDDETKRLEMAQAKLQTATLLRDLASGMDLNAEELTHFILGTVLGLTKEETRSLMKPGETTDVVQQQQAMAMQQQSFGADLQAQQVAQASALAPAPPPAQGGPSKKQESSLGFENAFGKVYQRLRTDYDFQRRINDLVESVQQGPAFEDIYSEESYPNDNLLKDWDSKE